MNNYQLLVQKLDEFIRKYYKNQALRGLIYTAAFLLITYLAVSLIEYFAHFGTTVRTVLFYLFLVLNLGVLGWFAAMPLFHLLRLGKMISHEQAAQIIGDHFPNVQDKLLNTLQLKKMADEANSKGEQQVIMASIDQKIVELKPVPFTQAINLGENKRYLKYAAAPLIVMVLLLFSAPHTLLESTERLIDHQKYYEVEAPFDFNLKNEALKAVKQENFEVDLEITGKQYPNEVYVVIDGQQYRMNKDSKQEFHYTVRNPRENFEMQFYANGFFSRPYDVTVLPKPILQKFTVQLDYPDYIGKQENSKENVGDLTIPAGTKVSWKFYTQNTKELDIVFNDTTIATSRNAENRFDFERTFMDNSRYYIEASNKHLDSEDSIVHYVSVIPDAYPDIQVKKENDTLSEKRLFFTGEASDDYGLTRLTFNYEYTESKDSTKLNRPLQTESLGINNKNIVQNFFHSWNLNQLNIKPGDEVTYYFELWDNDRVNGAKSTRSKKFVFKAPTEEELKAQMDKTGKQIKSQLSSANKKAKELREKMDKARQKLLENKKMEWKDQKFIDQLMKEQKQLQKNMKKIKNQYQQNLQKQKEYNQLDQEMQQKFEQLEELFDKTMTKEMKKKLEDIEKMMKEDRKKDLKKELEKMEKDNKSLEKALDRKLELFKQMELEQKMEKVAEELDKMAKKQEELSKETKKLDEQQENMESDSFKKKQEELKKQQEDLNKEFEEKQKEMDEIKKLNQDLESPNDLENTKQEQQEIRQKQQQSMQNMQQNQNQDASENQKDASEKMEELSEQMQSMMAGMEQKSIQLNYQKVRQILENLVHMSTEQEELIEKFEGIRDYNPQYVELGQKQAKLKEDTEMIEDSLLALSKKVLMIKSHVNEQISDINYYMDKTREYLSDRKIGEVRKSQQYIMTATNNLANMLYDIMDQMQQQMASQMKGSQKCQNPKSGQGKKPGKMGKMKKMQQKLGKKLNQLKKGKQPGRQGANSKQLARMAELQQQIRQKIRQMQEEQKQEGGQGGGGDLSKMQEMMEKNEEDILNKNISEKTLERQKKISVQMLKYKEAEKKQGIDKKRESKVAEENKDRQNPPELEEYMKAKEKETELLQTVPPTLNGYYRMKVKEYFKAIQ